MTIGRIGKGLVALSLTAVAVVGFQAPVSAQQGPPEAPPCGEPGQGQGPQYPPGSQGNVSDSTPNRGQQITARTDNGTFDRNTRSRACFFSTPTDLGQVTVNANGAAVISFSVPRSAEPGPHTVQFTGYRDGVPAYVDIPVTVQAAAAGGAAPDRSSGRLPRTGADHVLELSLLGGAMVLVGAGAVTASRRRRSTAA